MSKKIEGKRHESAEKLVKVRRLEQNLEELETSIYFYGYLEQLAQQQGKRVNFANETVPLPYILKHPEYVREHVTSLVNIEDFDVEHLMLEPAKYFKFANPRLVDEFISVSHELFNLAEWITQSRRVYQLDEDLKLLLMGTQTNLDISEIKMPFPTFGISLENPIMVENEERNSDFILVSITPENPSYIGLKEGESQKKTLSITTFPVSLGQGEYISDIQKKRLERAMKSGNYGNVRKILNALEKKSNNRGESFSKTVNIPLNGNLKSVDEVVGDRAPELRYAVRIALGTVLYMEQQSNTNTVSRNKKLTPPRKTKNNDITENPDIFSVKSTVRLSKEDRELLKDIYEGKISGDVSAHFRTGHWRRPKGTASNPLQQKTEWVNPTIVRRDKLAEGQLPQGRQVELESREK